MDEINYILEGIITFGGIPEIKLTKREDFTEEDNKKLPKIGWNGSYEYYSSIGYKIDEDETKRNFTFMIFGFDYKKEKDQIIKFYEPKWQKMIQEEPLIKQNKECYMKLYYELMSGLQTFIDSPNFMDISKYDDIYELFTNDIDYPENADLLNGVPIGTNYGYVSTTYLNGFIKYVDIFHAIMIRRYRSLEPDGQDKGWEAACETVRAKVDRIHSNISESCEIDDVLILAESDDSYWLFWDDCDCSDSCIGRLDKRHYKKEDLIEVLHRSVPNIGHNNEEYIVLPNFNGWITL